jgi:hypothetical protein
MKKINFLLPIGSIGSHLTNGLLIDDHQVTVVVNTIIDRPENRIQKVWMRSTSIV